MTVKYLFSLSINLISSAVIAASPPEIAQQIKPLTVQLITQNQTQTGVIVGQDQDQYWVLSCNVSSQIEKIITLDRQNYTPLLSQIVNLNNSPLTLIPFRSSRNYPTAMLGDFAQLREGDRIYLSGWINWRLNNRSSQTQFQFTEGIVSSLLASNSSQIDFTYTNPVYEGMMGAPIFNQEGMLIGIHCQGFNDNLYPNGGVNLRGLQEIADHQGFSGGFRSFGTPPIPRSRENQPIY